MPTVPYSNPNQYQKVAQRLAAALPDAIWSNQFDNTANRETHLKTTGPEIWTQTVGRIDAFVAATGTGGTLAGVAALPQIAPPRDSQRAGRPAGKQRCTNTSAAARSRRPAAARSPKVSASAA